MHKGHKSCYSYVILSIVHSDQLQTNCGQAAKMKWAKRNWKCLLLLMMLLLLLLFATATVAATSAAVCYCYCCWCKWYCCCKRCLDFYSSFWWSYDNAAVLLAALLAGPAYSWSQIPNAVYVYDTAKVEMQRYSFTSLMQWYDALRFTGQVMLSLWVSRYWQLGHMYLNEVKCSLIW